MANIIQSSISKIRNYAQQKFNPERSPIPAPKPVQYKDFAYRANEVKRAVLQPLTKAQNFLESPKPVQFKPLIAPKLKNPVSNAVVGGGTAVANMGISVADSIINKGIVNPSLDIANMAGRTIRGDLNPNYNDLRSSQVRLGYNIMGYNRTPQEVIGNTAGTLLPIMDAYGGGKVFGIGKEGVKQAGKIGFKELTKKGMLEGAKYGAIGGGLQGLSDARQAESLFQQLSEGIKSGVIGAGAGAVLGGVTSGAGYVIGQQFGRLLGKYKEINPNATDKEAREAVKKYVRNELGQFVKGNKNKSEPQFYGDMRESLGLPRDGQYNKGFIDLEAEVGGAKPKTPKQIDFNDKPKVQVDKKGRIKVKGFDANEYVRQQTKIQEDVIKGVQLGLKDRIKQGKNEFKRQMIERYAPLIDPVEEFAAKNKVEIIPSKNINDQISRVLSSDRIASRYLKTQGFEQVIKEVPDTNALSEYLIAKRNVELKGSKELGRDLQKDQMLVQELSPVYEKSARKINDMYKSLLQMGIDEGLVDKKAAQELMTQNPDYVRIERLFSPEELKGQFKGGAGPASISSQSVIQKMKGSSRAIENPIVSLINRTYKVVNEVERNRAAKMLTEYKSIEGNPYGLRKIDSKEQIGSKNTISLFRNGKKEIWEVNKDVADAAKKLNAQQMPTWMKVITAPMRLFKAATTSLRIPFVASNIAKDQFTAYINSNKSARTSLLNPKVTFRALYEALGHGEIYKQMEKNGAIGTSFDIYRDNPRLTLDEIRSKKNIGSKVAYRITHPSELMRAYENILSRGEEFTRIQQYKGTLDAYLKQGYPQKEAEILASRAARQNTVDFARTGELAEVINWFIPYFRSGIQGARAFVRSSQKNPVGAGTKLTASIFMPMIASTIWNNATEDRKKAYDDISPFEKENNFIIVPPNPTQDAQKRWNVYKIPLPPGLSNLANVSRTLTLQALGYDPASIAKIASDLIGATTSLDITNAGNFIPMQIKPMVEVGANKNFFTGKEVVPSNMKNDPLSEQVYPWTSGTIRAISKPFEKIGLSPLEVQHLLKGYGGGTIMDIIGQVDKTLASQGIIPKEQAQGMDILESTTARFNKAYGGETKKRVTKEATQGWTDAMTKAYDYMHSAKTLDENGFQSRDRNESMAFAQIRLANPQILAREAMEARLRSEQEGTPYNPLYDLPYDRQRTVLTLATLPPGDDKSALQKENIEWLKPYWNQVADYSSEMKRLGIFKDNPNFEAPPRASARAQALMDAGNWKDPEVQAYLQANNEYKNRVRAELGLSPLESFASKFGGYTRKPQKAKFNMGKVKKARVKKSSGAFKTRKIKTPKLKAISAPRIRSVAKITAPKIRSKFRT